MTSVSESFRQQCPPLQYVPTRSPIHSEAGTVIPRALEVTYEHSMKMWEKMNALMAEKLDRTHSQIVIVPHAHDFSTPLARSLDTNQIGPYTPGFSTRSIWPDNEMHVTLEGVQAHVGHTYVVASPTETNSLFDLMLTLDALKHTYNTGCITLICPFLTGGRGDKNVDKLGGPQLGEALNIRTVMGMFREYVDRMVVFEPHSSATQACAAENNIPLAPFSLGTVMLDHIMQNGVAKVRGGIQRVKPNPDEFVLIRPDEGRNRSLKLIERTSKLPSVGFDKTRLSGSETLMNGLTADEIKLVKGRVGFGYDDEYSTGGTLEKILDQLREYGMVAFAFMVAHWKGPDNVMGKEDWRTRIQHPLLTTMAVSNSRAPVGSLYKPGTDTLSELAAGIEIVSLVDFIRQVITADMQGVNFWDDPEWSKLLLQG